ncbi:efflux RND transporter periplasmic adaptor subunit [Pseudocolwellia sp. HL-MZ19]|uniref:efflux RND transporter periplasmic adaptor subunit n=1 Tax=Pseudocolwellia sp. HL-MZ19 TaxID=3400846 RepID=UPI003CF05771
MFKYLFVSALLALTFVLSGCEETASKEAAPQLHQPIDVAEVLVKPVQNWHTYTTRLESPEEVALMPRISGVINHIAFKEGEAVAEGDLLFQLDGRPFEAIVSSLNAQVVSAKAAYEQAKSESKRAVKLAERNAISTEEVESRKSTLRQRAAQVAALEAQIVAAELDVEFASIRSPIDGVISRANITKGNNVIAGQSILTSIVSNKKMYAYFDIDERTWNQSFSDVTAESKQHVVMQKVGQKDFAFGGHIDFIDNRINPSTGTLRVRAVFEDDTNQLRTGSFARIKVAANAITEQIIVPARAIGTDLENNFILVVNADNVLQYRLVEVGERYGKLRAITSGLVEGDIIAVNGPARVGPGMTITPNNVTIDSDGIAFTLGSIDTTNLIAKY